MVRILSKYRGRNTIVAGGRAVPRAVTRGDHVDMIANVKYSVRGAGVRVATRTILRNLLVIGAPSNGGGSGLGSAVNANAITFAVTDTQAQKLFFAAQNTSWSLVLRPVAKPSDSPESIQTMQGLMDAGLSPAQISQVSAGQGAGSISNGG